jgi:hypothetical protein
LRRAFETNCPEDAQLAQARVNAQTDNNQALGGVHAGSSASGAPVTADPRQSIYFGV